MNFVVTIDQKLQSIMLKTIDTIAIFTIDMQSMVAFINDRGKFFTLKKQRFVHIKPLHKSTGKSEQIFALAKLLVKTKISPIQRQQHRHPHWQHVK